HRPPPSHEERRARGAVDVVVGEDHRRAAALHRVDQHRRGLVHAVEAGGVGELGPQRRPQVGLRRLRGDPARDERPGQWLGEAEAPGDLAHRRHLRRPALPPPSADRARDAEEVLAVRGVQPRRDGGQAHQSGRFIRTSRTVRVEEFITRLWVWAKPPPIRTPSKSAPLVTPVAAKIASARTISARSYFLSRSVMPSRSARPRSSALRNTRRPWNWPPTHFSAAQASTPSGAPPWPTYMSTPVSGSVVLMTPATSPSVIRWMRAPASLSEALISAWRGRSSTQTVICEASTPLALAS